MKAKEAEAVVVYTGWRVGFTTYSRKNGSFTVRKSYFFRRGETAEDLVRKVLKIYPNATIVGARKNYRLWPSLSYFSVEFIPSETDIAKAISGVDAVVDDWGDALTEHLIPLCQ